MGNTTETVFPDSNFILTYCVGKLSKKRRSPQIAENVVEFVKQKRKAGIWTEVIRVGFENNFEKVLRECVNKVQSLGTVRVIVLKRKAKFEGLFKLETYDATILPERKRIAQGYFSGPKVGIFLSMGKGKPQDHDYHILAEAMILKDRFNDLVFYSYDEHFGFFRAEIEKVTGIPVVDCNC